MTTTDRLQSLHYHRPLAAATKQTRQRASRRQRSLSQIAIRAARRRDTQLVSRRRDTHGGADAGAGAGDRAGPGAAPGSTRQLEPSFSISSFIACSSRTARRAAVVACAAAVAVAAPASASAASASAASASSEAIIPAVAAAAAAVSADSAQASFRNGGDDNKVASGSCCIRAPC